MASASLPVDYQHLFRALPDNYLLLSPDGTILDNSDRHVAISLRPREEVVGRNIFEAFPPNDEQSLAELSTAQEYARQHRVPHTVALRYDIEQPAEQGGGYVVRHWEIKYYPILDVNGEVLYLLQRPRDVTEQRLAAEQSAGLAAELNEARNFSQFVLDTLPLLVATTGASGQADYFNPRWQEFTGRPLAELVDGAWTAYVHPDDLPNLLMQRDRSLENLGEVQYDFRLLRHDGQYRWMLGRTIPRLNAAGEVLLRVGVSLDVHEQKELVRELLEASEQQAALSEQAYHVHQRSESQRETFYALFMQAPAVIAILRGPQHVFEFVNPLYQALFPGRQMLGLAVAEAVPEIVEQGFGALLDNVYRTGESFQGKEMPLQMRQPDGHDQEMYFNFTYQPFREDGQIVGLMAFAYDVSSLVLARQQLAAPPTNPPR